MHIPENYLSPATCGVMGAAMVPVWAHAVKKVNEELPKDKIPLLGDIPLIKSLFSYTQDSTSTEEIVFIIAPRIIDDVGHLSLEDLGYSVIKE